MKRTRHPAFFYVVWFALFLLFSWLLSNDHSEEVAGFLGLVLSLIVGDWFVIRWSERAERKEQAR
jgi:hypothetical protein